MEQEEKPQKIKIQRGFGRIACFTDAYREEEIKSSEGGEKDEGKEEKTAKS